jgi:hypothetical protein
MSGTEFDVVIAAYLIPDLASEDFDALVKLVAGKQLTVEGVALVTNDAEGHVTINETGDHLGRKGLEMGGGVGLVVGLFAPSVLFVYYTYTQQTLKVVEAMSEVLRGRGCDVTLAPIGFTDPRYAERFKEFPLPHPFRELAGMIPAEARRRPAKITIPAGGAGQRGSSAAAR